jgi:hypothetical protein
VKKLSKLNASYHVEDMGAKQYFFCRKLDFEKNAKKLNFDFLLNTHRFFLSIELSTGFRPLRIR